MTVIVARLHAGQAVRLQMAPDLSADTVGREQRLDTRSNPLQLKAVDRLADQSVCPAGQHPHADGLLAGGRRDRELADALQCCQVGARIGQQGDLMRTRPLTGPALTVEYR